MATLTIRTCDECSRQPVRFIEVENRLYCSRECYLSACKRRFDNLLIQELQRTKPSILSLKGKVNHAA